ncbi:MAG: hypothetical protein QOC66_1567 [Pseudonocardiales bacterium]|nr:hypothetical protein [Pseudonocardiales bacterium]
MDITSLIDHLALNGPMLAVGAAAAGLDTPVPGTQWDVRSLVTHVGGIHRWAADIVATGSGTADTEAGRAVGTGPGDAELLDWFREGHLALVDTLRSAQPDLQCFTFLPAESPLHFWARRQAHETAIHRADAQAAAGDVVPFADLFAQDGIAEILHGFAARRKARALEAATTIGLDAVDGPSWLITLGGERIEAVLTEDLVGADVTIRGLSSDLYLWLWNRPSEVIVDGADAVAAGWAKTVRVRWS